ncbi:hypothetical protein [Amycolatopsis sp. FDAARGOS 1241]|uniref:hypothetical protein n=1 Tax=Amycolatopsis sp. FDAARGOS 1241 TaxID=2778070 RepID=UPI001952023E|nr:hypothetical protein [Amycolatopsis sp. FDAARGOS 1241]QRP42806.1 hypothetical protein I6J71_25400 [Amycolatopsis sp. FDAARGOS 1241]
MEQTITDYVGKKQAKTTTNLYGESCRYCAERVSADELGLQVNQPYYSDARKLGFYQKPIRDFGPCTRCQVDMNPKQFKPNTDFEPGGRFGTELKLTPSRVKPSSAAPATEEVSKGASVLGQVSTAFKRAGRGFAVFGIAADIYDVVTAPAGQKVQTAVKDTSALAGALAGGEIGAEWGAAIGTFIEPRGRTVVGGIIGGIAGAVAGRGIGDTISSWF